jgi:hypothetical protein
MTTTSYHHLLCCNRTKEKGDGNKCHHLLHCNTTKEEEGDDNKLSSPFLLQQNKKNKGLEEGAYLQAPTLAYQF